MDQQRLEFRKFVNILVLGGMNIWDARIWARQILKEDIYYRETPPYRKKEFSGNGSNVDPAMWPTKTELYQATAHMRADTVLQILHGQGLYWGYDCERYCDNTIPKFKILPHELVDTQSRVAKIKLRRIRKKQEKQVSFRKEWRKAIRIMSIQHKISFDEAEERFRQNMGL